MTFTNRKSLIALLLTFVLVFSLFTVSTLADDTTAADENESVVEVVTGENVTGVPTTGATEGTTEAAGSEAATEEASEEHEHETETETGTSINDAIEEQIASTRKTLIINGIIIAAIIIILVVVAVKFREKLGNFFRSVKSERKKIVWASKENTLKGFLVVIVIVVAVALMIGLVDYAFDTGINGLNGLFN